MLTASGSPKLRAEARDEGLAEALMHGIDFGSGEGARRLAVLDGKGQAGFAWRDRGSRVAVDEFEAPSERFGFFTNRLVNLLKGDLVAHQDREVPFDWRECGWGVDWLGSPLECQESLDGEFSKPHVILEIKRLDVSARNPSNHPNRVSLEMRLGALTRLTPRQLLSHTLQRALAEPIHERLHHTL